MATLKLGKVDKGKLPKDPKNFLAPYHASMSAKLQKKHRFRDEGVGIWRSFLEVEGTEVQELQHFCLLYTSPSPRDATLSRMPSSA